MRAAITDVLSIVMFDGPKAEQYLQNIVVKSS